MKLKIKKKQGKKMKYLIKYRRKNNYKEIINNDKASIELKCIIDL